MRTVAFCEIDPFCRRVLAKHWPRIACYDDIRTLTAKRLAADSFAGDFPIDVICGGFPCQDISVAGKGAGIDGARSGLWSEYARVIGEVRPRFVIVENVAALLGRGLSRVLGDLAALGFDAEWRCIRACDIGAPHIRDRVWIVAYSAGEQVGTTGQPRINGGTEAVPADTISNALRDEPWRGNGARGAGAPKLGNDGEQRDAPIPELERLSQRARIFTWRQISDAPAPAYDWRLTEPAVCRADDGIPHRVDRIKSLGNAVVPQIPEIIGRAILAASR